nr:hypothetical protein [Pseudomonadota bacterium]
PAIYTVTLTALDSLGSDYALAMPAPGIFNFTVTFKNLPESLPQTASTTPNYTVIPMRRQWMLFIPLFNGPNGPDADPGSDFYKPDTSNMSSMYGVHFYPNGIPAGTPSAGPVLPGSMESYNSNPIVGNTASFGFNYGYTDAGYYTLDNYFYFKVTYPTATGIGEFTTPLMGFMIWSTPANSAWVYDYTTNTMTQTP